jgi:hypothetical protein
VGRGPDADAFSSRPGATRSGAVMLDALRVNQQKAYLVGGRAELRDHPAAE